MTYKEHLKKYLKEDFINELIDYQKKDKVNSLILNTNKMSIDEFKKLFPKLKQNKYISNAFYFNKEDYDLGKSFYFDNGLFYIMDAASLMVSFFLDIKDDDYILDMCAAPGGKTISCSIKNNNAQFVSNDINYKRALTLSSNIEKLGFSNIIVTSNDLNKFKKETFDKIILDAPCSGSAMFRKDQEMEKDWTYEKVLRCKKMQEELLEIASTLIKEGGIISYSTCSFSYEEDEEVILNFINNHKDFELVNLNKNNEFFSSQNLKEAIHLFPNLFDGEGQFICQIKKKGNLIKHKNNDDYKYLEKFKYKYITNDNVYLYNNDLNLKDLTIIRKGLHYSTFKNNNEIPSFHFAHYLSNENSIVLSEEEKNKYLHGEEITKYVKLKNGYYTVSFNNINLGFIHKVDNKLKNLYPKGLRH